MFSRSRPWFLITFLIKQGPDPSTTHAETTPTAPQKTCFDEAQFFRGLKKSTNEQQRLLESWGQGSLTPAGPATAGRCHPLSRSC